MIMYLLRSRMEVDAGAGRRDGLVTDATAAAAIRTGGDDRRRRSRSRCGRCPLDQLPAKWRGSLVSATAIAASHDGKQLATGAENGAMTLWNLAAETPPAFAENTGAPVSVFALSLPVPLLAIAGVSTGKPAIFVRNLDNGQLTHTLLGHDAAIRSLAFASDNARLVSGSDDRTIRVWNLGNAEDRTSSKAPRPPSRRWLSARMAVKCSRERRTTPCDCGTSPTTCR